MQLRGSGSVHRHWNRPALFLLGVALAVASLVAATCMDGGVARINLSDAIALSASGKIQHAEINSGTGIMTLVLGTGGSTVLLTDTSGRQFEVEDGKSVVTYIDSLSVTDLKALGFVVPPSFGTNPSGGGSMGNLLWIFLPLIIFPALLYFILRRRTRSQGQEQQQQRASIFRSRARLASVDRPTVTFSDVAGAEEAKQDLMEVVEFLKDRSKFQALGATIPKGVLLVGPPGTGKTLLARAVAGEAEVPFFSVSGSEFVEMYVGVGAARVRDLFDQAKRSSPSIVFIDEIDAVGRARSGAVPGSHEEREQTLNQILVEMDGFDPNIGVIVIAATNRPDILDAALLRPGRFDRRVTLDPPDMNGRLAILKIHARGKKLQEQVDLGQVARQTHGFSGADLANLMNEAAILAVRRDKQAIGIEEIEESIDRVIAGPERKSLKVSPRDRETTAYHEGGHALVAYMLPNGAPVQKISIVARGSMGGYTRLLEEDRFFRTASQFRDSLAVLLAGHAAEEMMFNEASTGPHSDIKQATNIALKMITDYGMSEKLGLRTFGTDPAYLTADRGYSEEVAREIDLEVRKIIENARQVARKVLKDNKPRLVHLARKLLVAESLSGPELESVFTEPLTDEDFGNGSILASNETLKQGAAGRPEPAL